MSAVVETLRKATGRTDVVSRVEGLERAVEAARGRLDEALVADAADVAERATARLKLSADHTIVALAGATGSGKSSLFNDICGLDLAAVGVKRPTTSWALACAWGPEGANEILDWLGIPKRHQISRMGLLDESADDRDLQGLVLLDLPDHDSTEVSHHLEVERLVKFADAFIWVLDPQKYADAAIHDRFLKPLSTHADVMMVAFNHIDEIPADQVDNAVADVRRLLTEDGLGSVPVFATSATRGDGVDDLRAAIIDRVAHKKFSRERLTADVRAAAARIAEQTGDGHPGDIKATARDDLVDACADAAGVPVVVDAIEAASLLRARSATGWPVTKWLNRFRRNPLRRLHLDGVPGDGSDTSRRGRNRRTTVARTSLPEPTPVQRARVDAAVRGVADSVTVGMAKPWADAVRQASVSRLDDVSDALDKAVANTDLGVARDPFWWKGMRAVQWLLFLTAVVGAGWLAALAVFSYLQLPEPGRVDWLGIPVPTMMLIGGVLLGVLVAVACRFAASVSARRRASRADNRLRAAIEGVTDELVVDPMREEVGAYTRCRDGAKAALRR
jgi:GTP-binding protein EngB required for normal cell division